MSDAKDFLDHVSLSMDFRRGPNFYEMHIFSDISERNNDYSDTLYIRSRWVGDVGVITFFVLKVPDYKSAMLYTYIFIVYVYIYI